MTWEQTARALQAGEQAAERAPMHSAEFAAFYERAARPLWAYLARVSGNAALAEDLMQEAFVRFLCSTAALDGEVHAKRYLFKIATNLLRDHWRAPAVTSIEDFPETMFAASDGGNAVESHMVLMPAFVQMKPKERQMLWLAHAEGYSHKEIAEVMGVRATSVRLMLFRARRKLAQLLEMTGGAA